MLGDLNQYCKKMIFLNRLFPPVPIIGRLIEDDIEIDGKFIPAGTVLNLNIMSSNRNAKYFNNPDEFIPDRFFNDSMKNENNFVYVPFSAGPR
jgi:docosahexaenoic acid omega-hydroxylase